MRVLLHACCGPCSIMPVTVLREAGHDVTAYFANPNIHPVMEYLRRREAMEQAAAHMHLPVIWQDDAYSLSGWLSVVHERGIADNEDGVRCAYCYASRLTLAAAVAREHGFDAFTTSLLYSRHQRHESIREEGERAALRVPGSRFLYMDFRDGWQEGIDISKSWGLYRQNYCACIFSEEERFARKVRRLAEQASTGGAVLS